jgi:hypothetical protein
VRKRRLSRITMTIFSRLRRRLRVPWTMYPCFARFHEPREHFFRIRPKSAQSWRPSEFRQRVLVCIWNKGICKRDWNTACCKTQKRRTRKINQNLSENRKNRKANQEEYF